MLVQAELQPTMFTDDYKQLEALRKRIALKLKDEILVTPAIQLVPPGSLPRSDGKAKRVVDNRKN
jgi:phenylacetate-CoA ligase